MGYCYEATTAKKIIELLSIMDGMGETQEDITLAFISEAGELVNNIRHRWWDGGAYERKVKRNIPEALRLPEIGQIFDAGNFFLELADCFALGIKGVRDKIGSTEGFLRAWEEGMKKASPLKGSIKKIVLSFVKETNDYLMTPDTRGAEKLALYFKTFDRIANRYTENRAGLSDLMVGKLLLLELRMRSGYNKSINGIEDNRFLIYLWYRGNLKGVVSHVLRHELQKATIELTQQIKELALSLREEQSPYITIGGKIPIEKPIRRVAP